MPILYVLCYEQSLNLLLKTFEKIFQKRFKWLMYYHSNLTLHIQDRLDCGVRRSSRGGATWWHHPPPVQQGVHGQLCQTRPSL